MEPNFHGFVPDPDRGGDRSPSAVYFNSQCNTFLKDVLDKARVGTLNPGWRGELSMPAVASGNYSDAAALAVQELNEMEPALWEPSRAPHWRAALDAWFVASRTVLGATFTRFMGSQLHGVETADLLLAHQVTVLSADQISETTDDAQRTYWSVVGGDAQLMADRTRRRSEQNYVHMRDWLTASYLGGLAAGGTPGPDWREWLRTRAEGWSDETGLSVRRVHIETNGALGNHPFDRLPDYWRSSEMIR